MDDLRKINLNYVPLVAVWEVTMNCNMRCKHCGSSCEGPLPDELTTEEALKLCDDMAALGLRRITLSGGEVFTRPDWDQLVERLTKNGVKTNVLSNGWLLDRETVKRAKKAGVTNIGISLDGLEDTHDFIRKKGSYERIMKALDIMKEEELSSSIVSCLHRRNLKEMPELKKALIEKGVRDWQLQTANPMGNLLQYPEWLFEPREIDDVIDFAYETMQECKINVYLGDDVGYFSCKEAEVRKKGVKSPFYEGYYEGCSAGKRVMGIRCNGDIIGCLYIRDDSYIEGNVRDTALEEIWNRKDAFAWNRDLDKSKLQGFCKTCQYGSFCLGGCSGKKLINYKTVAENKFCSYRNAVEVERKEIEKVNDFDTLVTQGREKIEGEEYQLAEIYLSRALQQQPGNTEVLNLLGFAHYSLENYPECERFNRKVLEIEPGNAYSHKGLGICLSASGQLEEGIKLLKKSIELASDNFMDPYHDLAVILANNNRCDEALEVLEQGRNRSPEFKQASEDFYRSLKEVV